MTTQFNFTKALMLTLLTSFSGGGVTYAQPTLVTPSNSDNYEFSMSSFTGINAASIAYKTAGGGNNFFFAVAGSDGGSGYIFVTDPILGQTVSFSPNGTVEGNIDVIIGDNYMHGYTPGQDFIIAIAYASGTDALIEYHTINNDGVTLSYGSYLSTSTLSGYDPSSQYRDVHIDVVAEFNNTGVSGLPLCDNFVATWENQSLSSPAATVVFAVLGNLNTQSVGSVQTISPTSGTFLQPDVAAIQRNISSPPSSMNVTAWIAYVAANTEVWLTEYDFTTNTALSTDTLDDSSDFADPRIDAYDNYNTLWSGANYKVACRALSGGYNEIRTYDNNTMGWSPTPYFVSSQYVNVGGVSGYSGVLPPYNHYKPTVAGGVDYIVQHFSELSGGAGAIFMEPIDVSTSTISTSPVYNYYWVNGSTSSPAAIASPEACNAVCTPPNLPTLAATYAWVEDNGMGGYDLNYKVPSGYGFKGTQATVFNNNKLVLYPNPAKASLVLYNSLAPMSATSFVIHDIAGCTNRTGTLQPGRNKIDVNDLAAGVYVLTMYGNAVEPVRARFVKN